MPKRPKIGLIAGWGRYPFLVAHALERAGYAVHCVGIAGHADSSLARWCTDFRLLGLARMGSHVRYFRRHDVRQATMAGSGKRGMSSGTSRRERTTAQKTSSALVISTESS